MTEPELHIVTGAFSFTGKYLTRRLLERGLRVKTLTGHPHREHPFGERVPAAPWRFDDPEGLAESLAGATTLYNTYWIRFEHAGMDFPRALANTGALLRAARAAGLRRVVHISIVHADPQSPLPYFRAKGEAEALVRDSGLDYAILRPTVLFGREAILFNNIAWMLRKFPFFAIPGTGDYRLQPLYVDDLAQLAEDAAGQPSGTVLDAAGPETFTFEELVRLIGKQIGHPPRLIHLDPQRARQLTRGIGAMVNDVILTRHELEGLTGNLLVSDQPPRGSLPFSRWLKDQAAILGQEYFSEIKRHFG